MLGRWKLEIACGVALWTSLVAPVPALAQSRVVADRRAAAAEAPEDWAAQRALAEALSRAGDHAAAQKVLTRARRHAPSASEATLRLAQVWIDEGDYKRAQRTCRSALLKARGDDPLMRLCLARAYLAWNRSSKAFEELDQLLGQAPDLLEAQLVYAEALRLRSRHAEARAAYANARNDPRFRAEAELGLGRLELGLGHEPEAIAALRRALKSEPELPEAQFELGSLLAGSKEGLSLLEAAVDNRPGWARAATALGEARLAAGDAPGAEAAFREALGSQAGDFAAHRGLGRALLAQGRIDEAQASLQQALDLYANDAQTTLAMGEVLLAQGETDLALEELRHAADLDPANPAGLVRAAEVCVQAHRYTLALGYLDRLLGKHPQSAAGLALYGDVMRARGRDGDARGYYERALAGQGPLERARVKAALAEL